MSKQLFYGAALGLMAALNSNILPVLAGGVLLQDCAARDLSVFTLIEKHGEAQTLPGQAVADAFMDLLRARHACNDGRTEEAIAIYAGIAARLSGAGHRG